MPDAIMAYAAALPDVICCRSTRYFDGEARGALVSPAIPITATPSRRSRKRCAVPLRYAPLLRCRRCAAAAAAARGAICC